MAGLAGLGVFTATYDLIALWTRWRRWDEPLETISGALCRLCCHRGGRVGVTAAGLVLAGHVTRGTRRLLR